MKKRWWSLAFRSAMMMVLFATMVGMDAAGCLGGIVNPPGNGNDNCGEGNPAIRLTVSNGGGDVLTGFLVTVEHNNQTATGQCLENCANFPIGINLFGTFDLTIERGGYLPHERRVVVGSNDNCNPITQNVIVVLSEDDTVAALAGPWRGDTVFGTIDLRFGEDGEIIGAILYDQTIGGDGNFYVSYNNRPIRGVVGQDIAQVQANDPTRSGDTFDFMANAPGNIPIGFTNAQMSADLLAITGNQPGAPGTQVTYQRLTDIPLQLQDP